MNLTEVEAAALQLSIEDRKALALRIWDSIETGAENLIAFCERREREADADPEGWMDASEFLDQLRKRPR